LNDIDVQSQFQRKGQPKDRVVDLLRDAICSGYFPSGMRLIESELAGKMKVSRTPLREAMRQLEAEGMVEIVPNKGAKIISCSRDDIKEIYSIWSVLEGFASSMAIENIGSSEVNDLKKLQRRLETEELQADKRKYFMADKEFHEVLLRGCRRPRLLKLIKMQRNLANRYWFVLSLIPSIIDKTISEHREILSALDSGDSCHIRHIVEEHIFSTGLLLVDNLALFQPKALWNS